jgi:hypothetical protein
MTTEESNYCGFVCSDYVEKAREIRKALDEFAIYNPEEAKVVEGNVIRAIKGEEEDNGQYAFGWRNEYE